MESKPTISFPISTCLIWLIFRFIKGSISSRGPFQLDYSVILLVNQINKSESFYYLTIFEHILVAILRLFHFTQLAVFIRMLSKTLVVLHTNFFRINEFSVVSFVLRHSQLVIFHFEFLFYIIVARQNNNEFLV